MLWIFGLILHGVLAMFLIGALTHQAVALLKKTKRADTFVQRFGSVNSKVYATAVITLYVVTFITGAWIYIQYRVDVRPVFEDTGRMDMFAFFELKEHYAAFGLALLPLYGYLWKEERKPAGVSAEVNTGLKWVTLILTLFVWLIFLFGHIVNNARGL
jgi:hypothetical protein